MASFPKIASLQYGHDQLLEDLVGLGVPRGLAEEAAAVAVEVGAELESQKQPSGAFRGLAALYERLAHVLEAGGW